MLTGKEGAMSAGTVRGVAVALCKIGVIGESKVAYVYLVKELLPKEAICKKAGMHTVPIETEEAGEQLEGVYRRAITEELHEEGAKILPYDIQTLGECKVEYGNGFCGEFHLGVMLLPRGTDFVAEPRNEEEVQGVGWVELSQLAKACETRSYRREMTVIVPVLVEYFRQQGIG